MYNELIADLKEVSNWIVATASTASFAHDELNALHNADKVRDAADAIERLQSDLAKKDSQLTEWKNAWRIANSLYKSAQAEIDELRAYQHELVERIERLKAELSELKQTEQNEPKGDN